jgi:hypothetical protein
VHTTNFMKMQVMWIVRLALRSIFVSGRYGAADTGSRCALIRHDEHRFASNPQQSFPYRLEQAEIRRFLAMMLMDRAAPGDREKAQTLLREALESYTSIGMPRHSEITQTLLYQAAAG